MELLNEEMKGKVIIITGGNKGIGKGCAKVFAGYHATVVICGRNEVDGRDTENEINRLGSGKCTFLLCDISRENEVKTLIETVVEKYGKIDCLINNAGYFPAEKPLDAICMNEVEDIFKTNFFGIFSGCKYALPYLRKTKGSIINMSSVLARTGDEGAAIYSATKGAISSFTKSLAIDEARNGVRVNAVLPGNITTEMYEKIRSRVADPVAFDNYSDNVQWMGRGGTPEDVGKACLFLASNLAGFVTGVELLVSGGYEIGEGEKSIRQDWRNIMEIKK